MALMRMMRMSNTNSPPSVLIPGKSPQRRIIHEQTHINPPTGNLFFFIQEKVLIRFAPDSKLEWESNSSDKKTA